LSGPPSPALEPMPGPRLPGDPVVWLLVELLTFDILFIAFAAAPAWVFVLPRGLHPV